LTNYFLLFVFLIFLCCSYCYYIHLLFSWHVAVYRSYSWLDQTIQVSCSIRLRTRSFQRRSSQPSTYLGIKETKPDTTKPDTLWYYDTKIFKKTTKSRFCHLVQHPAWKRIRSIVTAL